MHRLLFSVHQDGDGINGIIAFPPLGPEAGHHIVPVVNGQFAALAAHGHYGHIGAEGFFSSFGQRDGARKMTPYAGERQNHAVVHKPRVNIASQGVQHTLGSQRKISLELHARDAQKRLHHAQLVVRALLYTEILAHFQAIGRLAVVQGEPGQTFCHFPVAVAGVRVAHIQGVRGGEQTRIDIFCYCGCSFGQIAKGDAGQFLLIDDDALAPTLGVVRIRFPGRTVETAAVVQVENKVDFGACDDVLQAAYRGILGVIFPQYGEFAVHVAVQSA